MAQHDNGIPLTQVKSHASSTGARRPNMTQNFDPSAPSSADEKAHLQTQSSGLRKGKGGMRRKGTGDSDDSVSLNYMGRLYNKIVNFSVITRYLVYIIPVALLLAIPLIVLPIVGKKDIPVGAVEKGKEAPTLFNVFLWIEIAWLTLWAGKVVAWLLPHAFMFLVGVVSSGTRKYATVLHNLQIPLSLFFWALASFITFRSLFEIKHGDIQWVKVMNRILGALFTSGAVYLVEKAIVQLIGISYHQRSFALRIKACKREVFLLGILYDASRTLFPMYCPEFEEEDYIISDSILAQTGKKVGAAASAPLKFVGNIGRVGDKVTAAFGNVASEITGKQVFNPNSAHSIVIEALEKTKPSEALARRIWMSFVCEGRDALYMEDFEEVLGPAYKEEADEAFIAIDGDLNGDISMDEMSRKIVEISKERKAITEGMKDIGQALRVFDKVLMFVVVLIVVFIFLAWFQSSFLTTVATAGTALLSLSFVFAVTTQEFLGSCIFLFVKHPYDVGDRVDITGPEKERLVVDKISLLYTVFTRIDKMQVVQVPNIILNNLWIENVSRSKAMKEVITINISYDTSFEDIELLRHEMENFVRHQDNSRDFQPDIAMSVGSMGDLDKLALDVVIKHKSNWHNDIVRATRRSKFMCALVLAMKKVPIYGAGGGGDALGGPANPTYSVAVTDEWAAKARDTSSKDKDAARLVPTATADNDAETDSVKEKRAMADLNTRDPRNAEEWGYRMADEQENPLTQVRTRTSEDRRRSHEGSHIDLMKRSSTRGGGRRKAGEALPPMNLGESSGAQPMSPRLETFDEEAQNDPNRYGGTLGGYYTNQSGASQPGYAPYRTPSNTLSPSRSNQPHPLQSQPYSRGQGPPPPGAQR
ncbi:serine/threonine protein kinase [Plectosphaerella plurivora]|uniref:Mechanosensitive ion channel protein n=1 Tax=Plectosphaerella plurivora TaxID=936078 RepID=A0A9P9A892_9PEZI|nr:serine/threonine protein kinase [Plectosphaerella plurivora]